MLFFFRAWARQMPPRPAPIIRTGRVMGEMEILIVMRLRFLNGDCGADVILNVWRVVRGAGLWFL